MICSRRSDRLGLLLLLLLLSCGSGEPSPSVDHAEKAQKKEQAEQWISRGIYQKALPLLQEIVALDPTDWEARFELGRAFMAYGDRFSEAAEQFEAALELAPDEAKIHRQLGIARRYLGQWEEARAALQEAVDREPDHARTQALLGLTLLELEQTDAARRALENSRRLDPDNVEPVYGLGELHRRAGRLEEACEAYRAALVVDPYHLGSRLQLGLCRRDLGDRESAQQQLELHRLINSLSDNVVDRTRPELARFQSTVESILALEPDNWRALEDLGKALEAREDLDAAREAYRKAVQISDRALRAKESLERLGR